MKVLLLALIVALAAFAAVVGYPTSNGRIIGGDVAKKDFPFVVSIQSDDTHLCGGFIYNDKWVITVASCVVNKSSSALTVSINDYKFITLNEPGEKKVTVYRVIVNNGYNDTTKENDIALIELSQRLELKPSSENVPEPSDPSCVKYDEVLKDASGVLPGWGLLEDAVETTTLHVGYAVVEASAKCNDPEVVYPYFTSSIMFCASSQAAPNTTGTSKTVPCVGDEGSPLLIKGQYEPEEPVVAGLFSFNDNCNAGVPSVFTRISVYYAWIGSTAGPQPTNCYKNTTTPTF